MNILFLGAPGCGKGTQSKIIVEKCQIPQISTGDLLRNEIKSETDLGLQIKGIISSGKFVNDETVLKLVSKRLKQNDCKNGFILDGYPRNLVQAESLNKLFAEEGFTLEYVFLIDVPMEDLVQRCTGRLICNSCGFITNSFFENKNERDKCPKCDDGILSLSFLFTNSFFENKNERDKCPKCDDGIFLKREDDNEETVRKRLSVYQEQTAPIIEYYKKKDILHAINGQKKPSEISENILRILQS